ncbi:MAG: hypothetical protein ACRCST_02770 [Turicibacter sp.]
MKDVMAKSKNFEMYHKFNIHFFIGEKGLKVDKHNITMGERNKLYLLTASISLNTE